LNAQHRFGYAAVRYLAVSSTVLVGASVVVQPEQFVFAIAAFHVLGYLVYLLALWLRARHLGWRHSWKARLPRAELAQLWQQLSWPTGGFLLGQAMRVVERSLASSVAPGAVALYYFAFRVFNAVRNLIGMSLATVILPGLARRHAADSAVPLGSSVLRSVGLALLFLVPACLVLAFFAEPVVRLLFGRGEFAGAPVEGAADVLRVLAVALLFFGLTPVLMSVLYARRQQKTIFKVMAVTAVVNLALALVLAGPYGLMGIAAAFAGAAVVNVSLVSFFARREVSNG
jgi:putative peptidoglycan lipid II flippase